MIDRATAIVAARRYAPPLVVIGTIDRRGARLRRINPLAIGYVRRAGLLLDDVYPGGSVIVRTLAPAQRSHEAQTYVQLTGLAHGDVYPPASSMGAEAPQPRARWGWAATGAVIGAMAGGPWGAAVGGGLGALLGGGR